ncbi:MAG: hypothetical protein LUC45_03565, partial [Paraprevotella sp.]|nr:hypothetical protein [Paraprevotella sp.]
LITRDDNGNVIPLSQRFDARKSDVRYREDGGFASSREEFEERQRRAVEEKGLVMPGLSEGTVKVVSVPRHPFTGKEPIRQAKDWAKDHVVGEHEMDNGDRYSISKSAIDKYLSKSAIGKSENLGVHLSVLTKLPEVINASVDAEVHPDYKKGSDGVRSAENGVGNDELLVHRMYGAVNIGGTTYRVKTTMHEFAPNGKKGNRQSIPHSYEVTKIGGCVKTLAQPFLCAKPRH